MMCFQCIHFLPHGGWWNEGVHAVHRASNTRCLQVMSHSSLKSLACWLSMFFLKLAVPWVPSFSQWCHSREENGRVQYRDECYSSSGRQSTVLWKAMNFLAQVWKADKKRETPLTEHVYLDSPESLCPLPPHPGAWSNKYSINSFSETPAGRCWGAYMYLNAKLAVINLKTWVCESHIEWFFQFIINTKGSNSSGW